MSVTERDAQRIAEGLYQQLQLKNQQNQQLSNQNQESQRKLVQQQKELEIARSELAELRARFQDAHNFTQQIEQ